MKEKHFSPNQNQGPEENKTKQNGKKRNVSSWNEVHLKGEWEVNRAWVVCYSLRHILPIEVGCVRYNVTQEMEYGIGAAIMGGKAFGFQTTSCLVITDRVLFNTLTVH